MQKGTAYIGTSGWSYKHWKGSFYPEDVPDKGMLSYYQRFFRTVEINSSFYHLPLASTFEKWRKSSPDDFIFAVKASRYITHIKKLRESAEAVERFFDRARELREKSGPFLFQLPPGIKVNTELLQEFLHELPSGYRYVFEFRNPAWFSGEIYSMLLESGAASCIYELGGKLSPVKAGSDFVYIRLHGPGGPYRGSYPREALSEWAKRLGRWIDEGKDVYCYFDNDERGFAAMNAMELQKMMGLGIAGVQRPVDKG